MKCKNTKALFFLNCLTIVMMTFCAATALADSASVVNPQDPYEKFNRVMYRFNEMIDKLILKPIASVYNAVLPNPVIRCFTNFYSNIDNVPTLANDLLQFNLYQAASDAWRLAINSTVGIVGLFDVASAIGLPPNTEDFGLTLARWGYKNSNYLVLPFFGPNTIRDAIGIPINYKYLTVYPYISPVSMRYWLYGGGVVVRRADLLRFQEVLDQASVDKYVFMRDAYMQHRAYLIQHNEESANVMPADAQHSDEETHQNDVSP